MPVSDGGSGFGEDKLPSIYYQQAWKRALVADAVTATSYFLGVGFTLIATPPTLAVLITVVGWSAAFSSAWAAFT